MERLDSIREQFLSYSIKFKEDWSNIPFIYVHLKSAFLSQKLEKEDDETSKILYEMSKINILKEKIIEIVKNNGEFYRLKTFIDLVSKPIIDSIDILLHQSIINSEQGKIILNKKEKLEIWEKKFIENSTQEIESFINNIKSQLNLEIADFTENHFENKNAGKAWKKILENKKITEKAQNIITKFENQCNDEISEIIRELENELKYSRIFINSKMIKINSIIDGKKIWNWSTQILGSGLTIGSAIAFFLGSAAAVPVGWAAIGVFVVGFLGSFFFESREKQENKARKKLEDHLRKDVSNICENLLKQMNKNLNLLIEKRISLLIKEISKVETMVIKLADTQKKLAFDMNPRLLELNKQIIVEALRLIGAAGIEYHIHSVARIPGNRNLIVLNNGRVMPKEESKKLSSLVNERVVYVCFTDDKKMLITKILGNIINKENIIIKENGEAHIQIEEIDIINIKLAQQITKIFIQK